MEENKMATTQQGLSRRRFLGLVGGGSAAAFQLAACPAPAPAPTASEGGGEAAAPAAAPVTLEFLAWGDVADLPAWDQISALYMERNPNVNVKVTPISDPNANFYTALQTAIAGGAPPDISSFQGWEWQTYADSGVLANVDDYVARDGRGSLYPEGVNGVEVSTKRDGKTYLIPTQLGTMVMFYAKPVFDAAGMAYPTDDWTMEEFLDMARKLTDLSGETKTYGLQANGSWFRDIHWIRSTGKQEFDSLGDPKTAMFNQPEIVEMLQLMASDVYYADQISPTPADLSGGSNAFQTGNVGMKYEGAWFFPQMNSPELRDAGAAVPFDVVLMPKGADESRPHRGWAEGIALPKSDNLDAAWDLANFITSEEGNKIYSAQTGRLPNTFDLIENFWIPTIKERFQVENGKAFLEAFKRSEVDVVGGVPRSKMWNEVVKPIGYDPMTGGSASAAEVLPKVDEALQAMLDEYWASNG
jgi:multiple sugar transport system substrate-binding protein